MADAVWWGWVVVACLSACLWIAGSEGGRRDGWMLGGCDRRCELAVNGGRCAPSMSTGPTMWILRVSGTLARPTEGPCSK